LEGLTPNSFQRLSAHEFDNILRIVEQEEDDRMLLEVLRD